MKLNKTKLKEIIQEVLEEALNEEGALDEIGSMGTGQQTASPKSARPTRTANQADKEIYQGMAGGAAVATAASMPAAGTFIEKFHQKLGKVSPPVRAKVLADWLVGKLGIRGQDLNYLKSALAAETKEVEASAGLGENKRRKVKVKRK